MKNISQNAAEKLSQLNAELKKWLLSQPEVSSVSIEKDGADVFICGHESEKPEDKSADEKTKLWSRIFDIHYQKISATDDAELNTNVWKSSYTGQEIAKIEMKEWIQTTVHRILKNHPSEARVLEVGCGNGLILASLLPHISSYVGIDTSEYAVRSISNSLKNDPRFSRVQLYQAEAKDINKIPENILAGLFDVVVINSVAQYFPDVDYLNTVLKNLAPYLKSDATVFIGDVRSFALNEIFLADILVQKSSPETSVKDVLKLLERQKAKETETLYDSRLFKLLHKNFDWISGVTTQLRRGHHHNEMNKFRYDVEIQCKSSKAKQPVSPTTLDWETHGLNLQKLEDLLKQDDQDAYQVVNIPNARVYSAAQVYKKLQTADAETKLSALIETSETASAIDPEALWQLAEKYSKTIEVDWDPESGLEKMCLRCYKNPLHKIEDKVLHPRLSELSNKITLLSQTKTSQELNQKAKEQLQDLAPGNGIKFVSKSTMNLIS